MYVHKLNHVLLPAQEMALVSNWNISCILGNFDLEKKIHTTSLVLDIITRHFFI